MSRLEEEGEAKISSFEWGILPLMQEEEILGLEIPMHDPHGVAAVDDGDDLPAQGGSGSLGIMSLGNYPIEELAALAQFHDEVDGVAVLEGPSQFDDVPVAGEVVHDLDLAADVVDVVAVEELAGGDGLAGQLLMGLLVGHKVGHPELTPPQLPAEAVEGPHVRHGTVKDPPKRLLRLLLHLHGFIMIWIWIWVRVRVMRIISTIISSCSSGCWWCGVGEGLCRWILLSTAPGSGGVVGGEAVAVSHSIRSQKFNPI